MINVTCLTCRTPQRVKSLHERCPYCHQPKLARRKLAPRRPVRTKLARSPLSDLPPDGRKLRKFLDAMGWSETYFAARVTRCGQGRIGRSFVSGLIHGRKGARFEIARVISGMMKRYGHSPSEFYPGVNDLKRPKKQVRHDWFAWQRRRKHEQDSR